ncbi:hypothetical protein CAP35_02950 [Chitinophagaceae bacterium IBVUCB1]|nr:hypothetical protein CAP35_02950 [Chitinophagaceae bacterium IBVUCB1]
MKALYLYIKQTLLIAVYAMLIISIAIYNGYPLLTPDSGSYIKYAFDMQLPNDRSPFYSLFVAISSLRSSLWVTIVVQALLIALLLQQLAVRVIKKAKCR